MAPSSGVSSLAPGLELLLGNGLIARYGSGCWLHNVHPPAASRCSRKPNLRAGAP